MWNMCCALSQGVKAIMVLEDNLHRIAQLEVRAVCEELMHIIRSSHLCSRNFNLTINIRLLGAKAAAASIKSHLQSSSIQRLIFNTNKGSMAKIENTT
jgi:hypothetical protein